MTGERSRGWSGWDEEEHFRQSKQHTQRSQVRGSRRKPRPCKVSVGGTGVGILVMGDGAEEATGARPCTGLEAASKTLGFHRDHEDL